MSAHMAGGKNEENFRKANADLARRVLAKLLAGGATVKKAPAP